MSVPPWSAKATQRERSHRREAVTCLAAERSQALGVGATRRVPLLNCHVERGTNRAERDRLPKAARRGRAERAAIETPHFIAVCAWAAPAFLLEQSSRPFPRPNK